MKKSILILIIMIVSLYPIWANVNNTHEIGTVDIITISTTDTGYMIMKVSPNDGEIPNEFHLTYNEVSQFQNMLNAIQKFDNTVTSENITLQFGGQLNKRVNIVSNNMTIFCYMYTNNGNTTAHFTCVNLDVSITFPLKTKDITTLLDLTSNAYDEYNKMKEENRKLLALLLN